MNFCSLRFSHRFVSCLLATSATANLAPAHPAEPAPGSGGPPMGATRATPVPPPELSVMPKVIVSGSNVPFEPLDQVSTGASGPGQAAAPDSAALLAELPGTAVVRNGPQTGLVQVRGLWGDRVKISLDGRTLTPACPNHMDPPLHYAAPAAVDTLTVLAGITPVSRGGDSIAGTVLVQPAPPRFATNDHLAWFAGGGGFYRSSNDGFGADAHGGVANRNLSAAYQGSWQTANDLRFPGGRVRDTGYDTQQHEVLAGLKTGAGVWSVDAGLQRTRDSGTPALPMDMIEDDSWGIGLKQGGDYALGRVEGRFYYHTIDHLMDNYSLRPVPSGGLRMFSPATSEDLGATLGVALPRGKHTVGLGTGFHMNQFDAYQQNAATSAQQDTLPDATRTGVGTYLEWQADWSGSWTTVLGARNDTVLSDAADVSRFYPASAADARRFNARDHDFLDPNLDLTAAVRFAPNLSSAYELGFARKTRAPSLLERYLWTPLSASAGQADGRTYLGNLELDPEVSHQVAATADWHGAKWQARATPFYNFVSDYIQGLPIARLDPAGRNVLEFTNLGRADLYGVDALARYEFNEHLAVRGTVSYVRGRNCDDGDNLYRIAPLRGAVHVDHRLGAWRNGAEVVLVDDQNHVARYNGEPPTPGYVLVHLRTSYAFRNRLRLELGVENVLNESYADHLGGINRVGGSDVPVGARIPGPGRFVYVAARVEF